MLIMDQKVATQEILGELDGRGVRFATLRMRSRPLVKYINSLVPADFTAITLDRPGPHNRPRVHEDLAVTLTSYPGTVRQIVLTGLGREQPARKPRFLTRPPHRKAQLPSDTPVPWWGGRMIRYEFS